MSLKIIIIHNDELYVSTVDCEHPIIPPTKPAPILSNETRNSMLFIISIWYQDFSSFKQYKSIFVNEIALYDDIYFLRFILVVLNYVCKCVSVYE